MFSFYGKRFWIFPKSNYASLFKWTKPFAFVHRLCWMEKKFPTIKWTMEVLQLSWVSTWHSIVFLYSCPPPPPVERRKRENIAFLLCLLNKWHIRFWIIKTLLLRKSLYSMDTWIPCRIWFFYKDLGETTTKATTRRSSLCCFSGRKR